LGGFVPLRNKYPITDWILSQSCVEIGDIIAYYSESERKEVHAEVIAFCVDPKSCILCRRIDCRLQEEINFYYTIVYKIGHKKFEGICTCGASHTSNPDFHLTYCDLNKETK
jgi:hypothetical protein